MHPCEHTTCDRWIAYGSHCAKHTSAPTVKPKPTRKTSLHPTREDRAGVPAIDATEVRVNLRPRAPKVYPWSHVRGGTIALTDCTVTLADGTTYTIPRNARKSRDTVSKPKTRQYTPAELERDNLRRIAQTANHHDYNEA